MIKQKELVPKRRFAEFNDEWNLRSMKELASFSKGRGYSKRDLGFNGNPIILYGHLYTDYQSYIDEVETYAIQKDNSVISQGNEVIVPSSGETAKDIVRASSVSKPGIILAGDLNIIKPNSSIDSLFLGLNITNSNLQKELIKRVQGSSVVHLYNSDIEEVYLSYPSLKEQQKIGEFFKHLDEMIALEQGKIDKTKSLKSAYLAEMFPAEGERVPKRRFSGFTDEWKVFKLSSLTDYKNGKSHEKEQTYFGKYELINLNSISIDGGLKSSGKYVNESSELLKKNDLVMILSDVGHGDLLGRVALIPENEKFVLNQRVALLRPNKTINPLFLFSFLNSNQSYFKNKGAGMSQLNISKGVVEEFEVLLPNSNEQQKIGLFFKKLDDSITNNQQKLEKLKATKQAYLHEMFV